MKFYSYFDGNTQFSQIFLGCIYFFLFFIGGGDGQITRPSPVLILNSDIMLRLRLGVSIRHILEQKKSFQ